jgi:hypothetical protein
MVQMGRVRVQVSARAVATCILLLGLGILDHNLTDPHPHPQLTLFHLRFLLIAKLLNSGFHPKVKFFGKLLDASLGFGIGIRDLHISVFFVISKSQ